MAGLNDWRVAQWIPTSPFPYTEADARSFIRYSTSGPPLEAYAITEDAGEFIGIISLRHHGVSAELGYWLLPHKSGRGLMREAVIHILGQRGHSFSSVFATVDEENVPSIKVLESSGLKFVGNHFRITPNRKGNVLVLKYEIVIKGRNCQL